MVAKALGFSSVCKKGYKKMQKEYEKIEHIENHDLLEREILKGDKKH